ncbi:MAG: secondary thiamine-phosphate synthase enzyme YjbQ [candidate division WOR-3 bacterium]|nr:secondary thiamine-phosphate synthase enzyme YjbQ [candidate division WOR-3 bacterium]
MVHSTEFEVATHGFGDVIDVTALVAASVEQSGIMNGIVCIANPGSTAGITTVEFEPGAVADLKEALQRLAPEKARYHHNDTWDDGNGFAHLRSALVGASQAFPVRDGAIALGTWQQIVLLDFDNRPRRRKLVATVVGE